MSHHVLLYGPRSKRLMLKYGYKEEKVSVLFNSNEDEVYRIDFSQTELDDNTIILYFVGRLSIEKKLNMLLQAVSLIKEKKSNLRLELHIVGDGTEYDTLKAQSKTLGLEGLVNFYGAIYTKRDLKSVVTKPGIFVCPGALGLSAMTAYSFGLPIVSHDNLGEQMPEIDALQFGIGELYRE
ncbi:MAG: glycosyltransferase, partial [Flavobacteriales bacterium]|nr:glycosyltransferase [Flavobacteriales bacterium]